MKQMLESPDSLVFSGGAMLWLEVWLEGANTSLILQEFLYKQCRIVINNITMVFRCTPPPL
jgi:hypothetical protein